MPDIVLTTLNARWAHASLGLRYLFANLGPLRARAALREFEIRQDTMDVVCALVADEPKIIGFGVYIWNVLETTRVIAVLKRVAPDIILVLGGPEVSYECESQEIVRLADYVICGEADHAFRLLAEELLEGVRPREKVQRPPLPKLDTLELPYDLYDARDLQHRLVYVEASRGCPFTCEFCLSALDVPVRAFALERFLGAMDSLLARGVRQFKFVDRTFNLNIRFAEAILDFFHGRSEPGIFLHFEMIPDRLPHVLRTSIARFPPGTLQFEVGVQTFDEDVGRRISRRQDVDALVDNFRFLRTETSVHIHADLIFGLPGESLESLALGFDRLVDLDPQEIQVGILKRLRGTPITRHETPFAMLFNPLPPYEILATNLLDFGTMQRLKHFAKAWDLVSNSGNFVETSRLILLGGSPFFRFLEFSDWLYGRMGRTHGIALVSLASELFEFLTKQRALEPSAVAEPLFLDYQRGGRSDRPVFLRPFLERLETPPRLRSSTGLDRQARHLSR